MFGNLTKIDNLAVAITEDFDFERDDPRHKAVYVLSITYILKIVSARTFNQRMKEITGANAETFRLRLSQSIYVIRNLKAFWTAQTKNGLFKPSRKSYGLGTKAFGKAFDISKDDIGATSNFRATLKSIEFDAKVVKQVCNVRLLDKRLQNIIEDLGKYCRHFTFKKMSFILRSHNLEVHDLSSELLCKAIIAFYHTSNEIRSKLHTLNFLRNTCKNQGTNMIKWFTAKKRSRLNRVGESEFALMVVSDNQLRALANSANGDYEKLSYEDLSGATVSDTSSQTLLSLSVNKIVNEIADDSKSDEEREKNLKCIRLLMGEYDESFSEWLLQHKKIKYSNDEYIDRVQAKSYIKLVSTFLQFSRVEITELLNTLRAKLV